jgi:hypothetical protein
MTPQNQTLSIDHGKEETHRGAYPQHDSSKRVHALAHVFPSSRLGRLAPHEAFDVGPALGKDLIAAIEDVVPGVAYPSDRRWAMLSRPAGYGRRQTVSRRLRRWLTGAPLDDMRHPSFLSSYTMVTSTPTMAQKCLRM